MSEYISKDALRLIKTKECAGHTIDYAIGWKACVDYLKALPSADVVPVVHGRWLPIVSYNNTYKCSECGRLLVDVTDGLKMVAKHYPYCHCGAKMDGERKE